jgi:hypothetical protein
LSAYHCAVSMETKKQNKPDVQMEAVDGSNKLHLVLWCQSVPKDKVPLGFSFQVFTVVAG